MKSPQIIPIDFQWPVQEPFLFCVHHYDQYPKGNNQFGVEKNLLRGREIGNDFEIKDGFRMYHGEEIPGFPVHPHRGFETITIVRKGYVDHADSMGAAGRYGQGDVQWMTAGSGVQHSEMFPLLRQDQENTLELFQIWLNLPRKSKMSAPHFTMFWSENIPQIEEKGVKINLIAGEWMGKKSLPPPPDSWASQPESEVLIFIATMPAGSQLVIPASRGPSQRSLYFFEGNEVRIDSKSIQTKSAYLTSGESDLNLEAGKDEVQVLVLQARAIGEPIAQYGPFVMTTKEEIMQTFQEYQKTQFGGWPWERDDMIHGPQIERFAKLPNGKLEKPPG